MGWKGQGIEEQRVRSVFMGLLKEVWLRCGPAPVTPLDKPHFQRGLPVDPTPLHVNKV